MPPSLLSAIREPCQPCYLSRMASASHSRPLTLALSPGRGNRFVDADSMLQQYNSLNPLRGSSEHNNQPYFQTPRFSKP
ncbi:hypothetical protein WP7S18E06_18560 [Aeromonas hydrophila]|nr:hypothetical protein WP7S18E06_18560 [Aeromonas hydrophila]